MDFLSLSFGVEKLLLLVLLASVVGYVLYALFFFLRLAVLKPEKLSETNLPISVVICARSEGENLRNNLPLWLEQNYKEFEVIVVNDVSWDDTQEVLEAFQKKYDRLRIVKIEENEQYDGGKKLALTIGIKGAKHEHLLLTDADCRPASQQWIQQMADSFQGSKTVVLGYSGYAKTTGFLNKLIRYEAVSAAANYLSFALAGIPYMGVGRNLAYTKKEFLESGGFKSHYHIKGGDDDLLINKIATKKNTTIQVSEESQVATTPKSTWVSWWRQRRRHLSVSSHYKFLHKFLLLVHPLLTLVFWVSFVSVLVFFPLWWKLALVALVARLITQISIHFGVLKKLGNKDLLFLLPLFEILSLFLTSIIHLQNSWEKPKTWN